MIPAVRHSALVLFCLLLAGCDFSSRSSDPAKDMLERAIDLFQRKEYPQARQFFESCLTEFDKSGQKDNAALVRSYIARILLARREFRGALQYIQSASTALTSSGDALGNLRLILLEGDVFFSAGDLRGAYARYERASSIADAFADQATGANSRIGMGLCLALTGEYSQAEQELLAGLRLCRSVKDVAEEARAQSGLGMVYRMLGRPEESVDMLSRGLSSLENSSDIVLKSRIRSEIALLAASQGRVNDAVENLRQAINGLRQQREGGSQETAYLALMAQIYQHAGKNAEAESVYRSAVTSARAGGDRLAELYCSALLDQERFLALLPQNRSGRAREFLNRLSSIARGFHEIECPTGEATALNLAATVCADVGDAEGEYSFRSRVIALDQRIVGEYVDPYLHTVYQNAFGLSDGHRSWYEAFAGVSAKRKRPEEALKVLDFSIQKNFSLAMRAHPPTIRRPESRAAVNAYSETFEATSLLQRELTARLGVAGLAPTSTAARQLRQQLDNSLGSLARQSAAILAQDPNAEVLLSPGPITPARIRQILPAGTVAVEYLPLPDRLDIFALTSDGLEIRHAVVPADTLRALISTYEQLLQDPRVYSEDASAISVNELTRFATLSTRLYGLLVRPVEDLLDRGILFVPSGIFKSFPFHTIERTDKKGNVKYLVEIVNVDYIPSLSALRYRVVSCHRVKAVSAYGNPTGKNWAVDYELRDVRSFFHDANIFVGLETSWDNVRSAKGDVVQFATDFTGQSSMRPLGTVALSNGLNTDQSVAVGFEQLSELTSIPVAVLSNEAVTGTKLGPGHALLLRASGVADVVVNEWTADRKASKFFSEYFYTFLSQGLAPGDPYRHALLNLIRIREVSHPRSWGQFFHFGIG